MRVGLPSRWLGLGQRPDLTTGRSTAMDLDLRSVILGVASLVHTDLCGARLVEIWMMVLGAAGAGGALVQHWGRPTARVRFVHQRECRFMMSK
jgi:hypothetical protein